MDPIAQHRGRDSKNKASLVIGSKAGVIHRLGGIAVHRSGQRQVKYTSRVHTHVIRDDCRREQAETE